MALSSTQHLSALQYPWFAKRAIRPARMIRVATPCSATRGLSGKRLEDIRRQVVGLVGAKPDDNHADSDMKTSDLESTQKKQKMTEVQSSEEKMKLTALRNTHNKGTRMYPPGGMTTEHVPFSQLANHQEPPRRSKTMMNQDGGGSKPKIVRFKMRDIAAHPKALGTISPNQQLRSGRGEVEQGYEVRGSAISFKKEGLKGLLEYKDLCTENEKRQNSIQASLKIFRRRIKLNHEKFIQPNDTPTDDYVVHPASMFRDSHTPTNQDEASGASSRPRSCNDHVRMLRSALQSKRAGVPIIKQTDAIDTGEVMKQNVRCNYRLPENPNWGKEVSFKDIKDDAIPNVKTYVLEDGSPSSGKTRQSAESAVSLTSHNLGVHNSITHKNEKKVKLGELEVAFDTRFLDWLEDSYTNSKICRFCPIDETLDGSSTPKRRLSGRS